MKWQNIGTTWRLYNSDGEQIAKVIQRSKDNIIWFLCNWNLHIPVKGPYTDLELAKSDCEKEAKFYGDIR